MNNINRYLLLVALFTFSIQQVWGQKDTSFIKDIPHYKSGKITLFYYWIREAENALELDTLENGFDSLAVRIWYHYAKRGIGDQIVTIKNQDSQWMATVYDRESDETDTLNPKHGWSRFTRKMFRHKILTLPDMDDIPRLEDGFKDGESYNIEISDKRHYRLYNYHVIDYFKWRFRDVRRMKRILKLIRREFGVKLAD